MSNSNAPGVLVIFVGACRAKKKSREMRHRVWYCELSLALFLQST